MEPVAQLVPWREPTSSHSRTTSDTGSVPSRPQSRRGVVGCVVQGTCQATCQESENTPEMFDLPDHVPRRDVPPDVLAWRDRLRVGEDRLRGLGRTVDGVAGATKVDRLNA